LKTIAIIPAGGKGTRTGLDIPKQYVKIAGKEIILYSLLRFQKNKLVDEIIVSAEPVYFKLLERLKKKYSLSKLTKIVEGGTERQDSVYSALSSIDSRGKKLIIVHDAARPLLPDKILTSAISIARKTGNAVVAIKARDTLLNNGENEQRYIERQDVYYIQTPQIFTYDLLKRAMDEAYSSGFKGTDESALVNRIGQRINIVPGSLFNLKITTNEDLDFFRKIIR
jgi:2-C-methyl-D-erythritol 4-phosphate cytidylyltransferase